MPLLELRAELRLQYFQPRKQRATRDEGLENGERRCQGDTMPNEVGDQ
jgi:hypothetical protein